MIYPQACRELWKNKEEKQAGVSPDPVGRMSLLNACWLPVKGLFVSSELLALKEPWSISSEGKWPLIHK